MKELLKAESLSFRCPSAPCHSSSESFDVFTDIWYILILSIYAQPGVPNWDRDCRRAWVEEESEARQLRRHWTPRSHCLPSPMCSEGCTPGSTLGWNFTWEHGMHSVPCMLHWAPCISMIHLGSENLAFYQSTNLRRDKPATSWIHIDDMKWSRFWIHYDSSTICIDRYV